MKSLAEIYQKYPSSEPGFADKGTVHSYIEVYEQLLAPYRECASVLEIGIGHGHSLAMWKEYFYKAKVHGVNNTPEGLYEMMKDPSNNILISNTLDKECVEKDYGGMKFDVIIEDASHIFEHSMTIYANFKNKLAQGGIYVIEDVADIDVRRFAFLSIDNFLPVEIIDRRPVKGRFDDVLVVIGGKINQKKWYDIIDAKFNQTIGQSSDMQGHMAVILNYAFQSKRIVEFGVYDCTSTWALVTGKPQWMRSYDVARRPEVDEVEYLARNAGIDFKYVNQNCLEADIGPCDLLFIDSLHTYEQLSAELEKHSRKVAHHIIMHDTTTFGNVDQTGIGRGLWPAIEEFVKRNEWWVIKEKFTHCNGLTVLERI